MLELCSKGSLSDVISPNREACHSKEARISLRQKLLWTSNCADALAHLHSREPPMIHRDLKPQVMCLTGGGYHW